MRRKIRIKIEGNNWEVKSHKEARKKPGGCGGECYLPEQFYWSQTGLTCNELLQSQIGLSESLCVYVCVEWCIALLTVPPWNWTEQTKKYKLQSCNVSCSLTSPLQFQRLYYTCSCLWVSHTQSPPIPHNHPLLPMILIHFIAEALGPLAFTVFTCICLASNKEPWFKKTWFVHLCLW